RARGDVVTRRHGRRLAEALGSLERFRGMSGTHRRQYDERAEAIRTAFEAGAGVSAIADRLEIPRSVVYRAINGTTTEGRRNHDR
ncbi:MAG: hypothetical protein ACREK4_24125, partial [Candidatus Rokuibacteriota bacterium]